MGNSVFEKSTLFSLSKLDSLKYLYIGNYCLRTVKEIIINGFSQLKALKDGNNSFDIEDSIVDKNKPQKVRIINCNLLESIEIGDNSFSDSGVVELENLQSLRSLKIGTLGGKSKTLYNSSFVIRSIDMNLNN